MHLKTVKSKITRQTAISGLMTGQIELEIKSGTSSTRWAGPKIPPAVWQQILAYFKKTYNDTKSECQVRLYAKTGTEPTWVAWAFPQEARTGMTAREIDNPIADTQRQQFRESEGYVYLGTVHHHCAASAFQSGTDLANERNQDGLHITVGKMDETRHDIHARFYFDGCEFEPDLSQFWDIGEVLQALTPPECHDRIARYQMTTPALVNTEFPVAWTENLILPVVIPFSQGVAANGGNGSAGSDMFFHGQGSNSQRWEPLPKRKEAALQMFFVECRLRGLKVEEMIAGIEWIEEEDVFEVLKDCSEDHDVPITDIMAKFLEVAGQAELEADKAELAKELAEEKKLDEKNASQDEAERIMREAYGID